VNEEERFVVFGAWDIHEEGLRCKILEPSWQIKKDGNKNGGFKQAIRHIKLCQDEGYSLKTFRMYHREGNLKTGTAKIKGFERHAVDSVLVKEDGAWFAYPSGVDFSLSEDLGRTDEVFLEGARSKTQGETIERSAAARQACLKIYGLNCAVCEFNFEKLYGPHGYGFIHVHHLNPISATSGEYIVNPEKDLRPVCPNCHAMLHRGQGREPLSISQLQNMMEEALT